ncbi:MAG: helix-turn-helix domain-containing protein [Alphaproteobacteria bacterium]
MTPFGTYIRNIRLERGISLQKMAADLRVSSAYLSALEHGHKGAPNLKLQHQICQYFSIIWDEAAHLADLCALSEPKPKMKLAGLSAAHFELGNRLSTYVPSLSETEAQEMLNLLFPDGA